MKEPYYSHSIQNVGFITAASRIEAGTIRQYEKESSSEDYVGKITAVFTPYLSQDISEGKFIRMQGELKRIVAEIRKK